MPLYKNTMMTCRHLSCCPWRSEDGKLATSRCHKTRGLSYLHKLLRTVASDMFPNIFILLKIACTIPVTSCECKRSASALHCLQNYMRASQLHEDITWLQIAWLAWHFFMSTTAVKLIWIMQLSCLLSYIHVDLSWSQSASCSTDIGCSETVIRSWSIIFFYNFPTF